MYLVAQKLINQACKIIVIQAENPDGDSLGSALALEEILSVLGKEVKLYCPVEIPKYLRYIDGWDRVESDFSTDADLAIIVDTTAELLLSKVLEIPGARHFLESREVLVIDHHTSAEPTLSFNHTLLLDEAAAASQVIYNLAESSHWHINKQAAKAMLTALLSDTLGLTTQNINSKVYSTAAKLSYLGASPAEIEEKRRDFMKKSPKILEYKGKLIERIEYFLDGRLAIVHVPWEEIQEYSDEYNPGALIGDELRLVEGVDINCVIKTYPDGRLTARIRSNLPVADSVAGYFGGGGHPYAAGFRIYEEYNTVLHELIEATEKALS